MQHYTVTGMSCAACQARVERAVRDLPGVRACSVNLLTNSMGVEGDASPETVMEAVRQAGYGATLQGSAEKGAAPTAPDNSAAGESRRLLVRLLASLGFLLLLMYVSMGHVMWGWPLPARLSQNPLAIGLLQLLLTVAVMVVNQKFFINGFRGLIRLSPNMDTLVALGSSAAFGYSAYGLFAMSADLLAGNMSAAHHALHGLYFESAAMILTLITVGKMLEARAKGKTTDALRSLMKLAPETATLLRGGEEVTVPVAEVRVEDRFVVRPGDRIPVDGVVLEGHSAVNESALTGESIPVDKTAGDAVSAATINQSGHLVCRATRVGEDTTLSQIIHMVSDAAATKAPIAKLADRVSGIFVPVVMGIALVTLAVWLILGATPGEAIARGIAVLVISCPCALGLATPVAIMVGSGVGAKRGILFKTAASLEATGRIRTVVLDKTGTVTEGHPRVTDVMAVSDETEMLTAILSLEAMSEHPLSVAIEEYGRARGLSPQAVTDFEALPGKGVVGRLAGHTVRGGNRALIEAYVPIPDTCLQAADAWAEAGKTPLFFATDDRFLGAVAVADTVKPDSTAAIHAMRDMGLRVVMLTGDNRRTADAIARTLGGLDGVVSEVLPADKAKVIREQQAAGKVAMVGDGINDAPALTTADVGMAIGAGTDVAIDAADVVLVGSRLSDAVAAIRLGRATLRNIRENLFWAFIYNIIGIPLAAGVWIPLFGWELSPMFGAAAMSLSSFCVVSNALRLNLVRLDPEHRQAKDPAATAPEMPAPATPITIDPINESEIITMQKTLHIEGMMCPRCEAHVKKALEAIEGVTSATADHTTDTATVTLSADVSDDILRAAVEAEGYTVK